MWLLFAPGTLLLLCGLVIALFPPLRPGTWYGYRTARSIRSQETWDDANRFGSLLMIVAGFLSLNTGFTCWYLGGSMKAAVIIVAAITAGLVVGVIAVVEIYLARTFNEDGRPRRSSR